MSPREKHDRGPEEPSLYTGPVRIIFAGTPQVAVPTLQALLGSTHQVVAVVTRPPARSGRGRMLHPSPVATFSHDHGIPVIEASTLRASTVQGQAARAAIRDADADLGVVVAYGALIPQAVLEMPRAGWINLHFSDLPRWRGAAPVQWAILQGDTMTASSVFQLDAGLDTGPVLSRLPVPIGRETAGQLLDRMAHLGAAQVVEVVDALEAGTAHARPQDTGEADLRVTHARRLTPRDGLIDFRDSADATDRRIRAVTPDPGAWTTLPDGRRLKLGVVTLTTTSTADPGTVVISRDGVDVQCGSGAVRLGDVAPAGRGWMDAAAWARGARLGENTRLGAWSDPSGADADQEGRH